MNRKANMSVLLFHLTPTEFYIYIQVHALSIDIGSPQQMNGAEQD